jgi:Methyltransferase domain
MSDSTVVRDADRATAWSGAASHLRPSHVPESAWHEHAPFVSWLVSVLRPTTFVELGTHNGYSYFSVCETLARLGIACSAHAVDTWQGDDQAGFYGEGVYPGVVRINEAEFADFSTLHRATFDEALDDIDDGTVDLLHIDGRHGYEDVSHDYRSWVPKLSPRAVVIFHDVAERREGFGVWRFWDEISSTLPSFRFDHNHGLGVLGVGPDLDPALVEFFAAAEVSGEDIRAFYADLGSKITAEYVAGLAAAAELHELRVRAAGAEERAAACEAELIGVRNQLDAMRASSSWRITAPLRALGDSFRRGS